MRASEPSARNFAIFCEVEFEGASLRHAAEAYEISPTRVQQIVNDTRAWYIDTTPEWVRETDVSIQPLLACRRHQARLEHLYGQAMQAWLNSQTEITTTRVRPGVLENSEVRVTQPCFGQVRYLTAAMQMSKAQIDAAERLCQIRENYAERPAPPAEESGRAEAASAPCAPETVALPEFAEQDADVVTLTLDPAGPCDEPAAVQVPTCAARHASPTPVRTRKQQRKLERHQRRVALRAKSG
jgi:plasmid maintenance system antidote protein VapI